MARGGPYLETLTIQQRNIEIDGEEARWPWGFRDVLVRSRETKAWRGKEERKVWPHSAALDTPKGLPERSSGDQRRRLQRIGAGGCGV
ncbi:hypothetical protein V6N11_084323 [Hibiscus sabdariffa]|uniref:Uncharacterized protein n=1 Tax=Hibiscus sabdariffa TaxID=183260 RepID=A0ABR2QSN8_9ROSI